jgi:hypothetical protein
LDEDFSAARAVEFTEKDSLPGAEVQCPILYQDLTAAANHRALDM